MKSTGKIAKEIGVSREDIEKRLNPEFTRQFGKHMEEKDGSVYFDAEVEEFLKLLFNKSQKPQNIRSRWYADAIEPAGADEALFEDSFEDSFESSFDDPDDDCNKAAAGTPAGMPAGNDAKAAREEAALAKSPSRLPALHWSELPIVRSISMPLNYQPEVLMQAVEVQRRELNDFLNQFDRLVDHIAPDEWQRIAMRGVKAGKHKIIRLVGTTALA